MFIISNIFKILTDALFPLSEAENEILEMTPEKAFQLLPPAPGYEGLAVPLPNSRSIFAYKDERVSKLVWNIKYKKSSQAVAIGGYALWRKLVRTGTESKVSRDTPSTLIIPMPITNRRRKERGYNQCELLVDEIERLVKNNSASTDHRFIFENNLLIRTHHASRQTLKGRIDRLESAKGIFGVNEEVAGRLSRPTLNIIVIDDVITTGSTMYEAIGTLKGAGFENVSGLSLAH